MQPMTLCLCGCQQVVSHWYRQGHDAKHVAQLARAVKDVQMSEEEALAQLPSEGLRRNLAAQLPLAVN